MRIGAWEGGHRHAYVHQVPGEAVWLDGDRMRSVVGDAIRLKRRLGHVWL